MILLIAVVINIFLSILVGNYGKQREIGFTSAFLLSLFFSPIIGILFVLPSRFLPVENQKDEPIEQKENVSFSTPMDESDKSDIRRIIGFILVFFSLLLIYAGINATNIVWNNSNFGIAIVLIFSYIALIIKFKSLK